MPKGVNVEHSPPIILLGDVGKAQVTIENLAQLVRYVENRSIGWQACRDGIAGPPGLRLPARQLIGQPLPEVRGEVIADRHGVPFAVLLVGGV
jgi:hypothetical protein